MPNANAKTAPPGAVTKAMRYLGSNCECRAQNDLGGYWSPGTVSQSMSDDSQTQDRWTNGNERHHQGADDEESGRVSAKLGHVTRRKHQRAKQKPGFRSRHGSPGAFGT